MLMTAEPVAGDDDSKTSKKEKKVFWQLFQETTGTQVSLCAVLLKRRSRAT